MVTIRVVIMGTHLVEMGMKQFRVCCGLTRMPLDLWVKASVEGRELLGSRSICFFRVL